MEKPQRPNNTFLIVNGSQVFPLEADVITIGRQTDNDLVIDDQRVSRRHARLEAKNGRFYIVDLNSRAGTSVNGLKAAQHELNPGDIISLAGVPLIFGHYRPGSKQGDFRSNSTQSFRKDHPTLTATESQDVESVDRYLEFFENDEEE